METTDLFLERMDQLANVKEDILGAALAEVEKAAAEHGLTVVAAEANGDVAVIFDRDHVTATQVVNLASSVGAKLLYVATDRIDAATIVPRLDVETPHEVAELERARKSLSRSVKRMDGWVWHLSIAFAHAGVLHAWEADSELAAVFDDLPDADDDEYDRHPGARLDEATSNRLAQTLVEMSAFRQARTHLDRFAVAKTVPELAQLMADDATRWRAERVVVQATHGVRQLGEEWAESLNISELAAALAEDEAFRAATTAEVRKRRCAAWITQHSNGLPMPQWLINELATQAKARTKGQIPLG